MTAARAEPLPEGITVPEDDPNQIFNLDLDDDADEEEREAAIRDAIRAVEEARAESRRRPMEDDDTEVVEGAEAVVDGDEATGERSEDVRRLVEERDEARERHLRVLADFENYRKRTEREREEVRVQALAELLRSVLEVVDNLERALESQASGEDLRLGIEMILKQVKDLNRAYEVEEIDALDRPFDPSLHDAVARREDPGVSVPTVVEELQRGYLHKGRLLRPARVMVAVPPERLAEGESDEGASSDA